MRPLSELLELVYDELNHPDNVNEGKTESIYYPGLCILLKNLTVDNIISDCEEILIVEYLYEKRPNCKMFFLGDPYKLFYRNKWLLKHIKINKNKENGSNISKAN